MSLSGSGSVLLRLYQVPQNRSLRDLFFIVYRTNVPRSSQTSAESCSSATGWKVPVPGLRLGFPRNSLSVHRRRAPQIFSPRLLLLSEFFDLFPGFRQGIQGSFSGRFRQRFPGFRRTDASQRGRLSAASAV